MSSSRGAHTNDTGWIVQARPTHGTLGCGVRCCPACHICIEPQDLITGPPGVVRFVGTGLTKMVEAVRVVGHLAHHFPCVDRDLLVR